MALDSKALCGTETHAAAAPFLLLLLLFFLSLVPPLTAGARLTARMTFFPLRAQIPLYPQIDALSEIDRRRRNECSWVTQRRATKTL